MFDGDGKGRINSVLQLFGNVTFWMFWRNGYEAMRALDDNGDGSPAGGELAGLGPWRDENGNGVSERGEVRALADGASSPSRHDTSPRTSRTTISPGPSMA